LPSPPFRRESIPIAGHELRLPQYAIGQLDAVNPFSSPVSIALSLVERPLSHPASSKRKETNAVSPQR